MGVYESLTREELVRKLLVQENLCHELQGKVGKLQEEIFQQAKNGEGFEENEGDLCEKVVVKRTEKFLADNVVRLSLMFIRMIGEFLRLFIIVFWRVSHVRLTWNSGWIC